MESEDGQQERESMSAHICSSIEAGEPVCLVLRQGVHASTDPITPHHAACVLRHSALLCKLGHTPASKSALPEACFTKSSKQAHRPCQPAARLDCRREQPCAHMQESVRMLIEANSALLPLLKQPRPLRPVQQGWPTASRALQRAGLPQPMQCQVNYVQPGLGAANK